MTHPDANVRLATLNCALTTDQILRLASDLDLSVNLSARQALRDRGLDLDRVCSTPIDPTTTGTPSWDEPEDHHR